MGMELNDANLTALQAAAWHMAGRYAEMLARNDMHAEHSPTVRAVLDAINAERRNRAPLAGDSKDAETIIRDLLENARDVDESYEWIAAEERARAYLESVA